MIVKNIIYFTYASQIFFLNVYLEFLRYTTFVYKKYTLPFCKLITREFQSYDIYFINEKQWNLKGFRKMYKDVWVSVN